MSNELSSKVILDERAHAFQVIYFEEESDEGVKGPLGAVRKRIQKIGILDFETFGINLRDFCGRVNLMLQNLGESVSDYNLSSFEISVDVTAKGEVRFIGSAGTDVKGGLKLIFQRKS